MNKLPLAPENSVLFMDPENENKLFIEIDGGAYETTHDADGRYSFTANGREYVFSIFLTDFFGPGSVRLEGGGPEFTVCIGKEEAPARLVDYDDGLYSVSIKNNVFLFWPDEFLAPEYYKENV